jgi:serine protease Do
MPGPSHKESVNPIAKSRNLQTRKSKLPDCPGFPFISRSLTARNFTMTPSLFTPPVNVRRLLVSGAIALQTAIVGTAVSELALTIPNPLSSRAALAQNASINAAEASVVFIETNRGRGSGVIVDASDLIVTNAHVLEGARQVFVTIQGRRMEAEVLSMGSPDCLDLALLQVANPINLQAMSFGDIASVHKTQQVYAIGFPGGAPSSVSPTITNGIVSNLYANRGQIQFDGPINGGNSGGAVVNASGELIGIATGKMVGTNGNVIEGMSFAVSVDKVLAFIEAYRQGGSFVLGQAVMPGSNPDSGRLEQTLALNGQATSGMLQAGDSTFCSDGSFADVYTFEAESGQGIMLDMVSQDMGVYLMLVSPSGEVLARTGRESQNQTAMILEKLPETGTYTVLANALQPERSGRYQLRATQPFLVEQGSLNNRTRPCLEGGQRCQTYEFQGGADQPITIVLRQAEFDPYLIISDASGNVVARGQTDRDAVVSFTLPEDGWYTLLVSSVKAEAGGQFMVSVHDTETLITQEEVSQR